MLKTKKFTYLIALVIFTTSCSDRVDYEDFSTAIRASFTAKDSTAKKTARNIGANVYTIYKENNFEPLWITPQGKTPKAEDLIKELRLLSEDGIDTGKYKLGELQNQLEIIKDNKRNLEIAFVQDWDKAMTSLYVQAATDLMYGVLDAEDVIDMWYHDNDTTANMVANVKDGSFPSLKNYRSKLSTYDALVKYRKTIEGNDSMRAVVDVNLERLRWLPQTFEDSYVLVVVPMMEMILKNKDKTVLQMKAVVGKPDRETPSLNADMANVVFNPSWGVPPGIMKKDVIPGLLKKGDAYLDKKDLKIYDRKGNEVNSNDVTEENYKQYVFRQDPGEKNALGQVKFDMPNPWAIYLHDTPTKGDFDKEDRDKSSGCVRLNHPLELAHYVLAEMNGKDYDNARIDSIISHDETTYVKLKKKLPVHIIYLTAYNHTGSELVFYKDIYNKDHELAQLLKIK